MPSVRVRGTMLEKTYFPFDILLTNKSCEY